MSEDLTVHLDNFDGPLDLLLYLIQREELSIYDIPIARITEQYLNYISDIAQVDLVRAGDFLVMAATLLGIKARMLLPKPPPPLDEETMADPRTELVRQLEAYKQMRDVVDRLRTLEEANLQVFARGAATLERPPAPLTGVTLQDLLAAFQRVLAETDNWREVAREEIPLREKIRELVSLLDRHPRGIAFSGLFRGGGRRLEVVITFLALLELIRLGAVEAQQAGPFAEILLRRPALVSGFRQEAAAARFLDTEPDA